jgi:cysteinyl-tRNA synthetase, unknown class
MKYLFLLPASFFLLLSCSKKNDDHAVSESAYKERMREFVISISRYSKSVSPGFLIIPQNGIELVSSNVEAAGPPHAAYLAAIDANAQEDLLYGYDNDNLATPAD